MSTARGVFLVPWVGLNVRETVEQLRETNADFLSLSIKDSLGRSWVKSDTMPTWRGGVDLLEEASARLEEAGIGLRVSIAVFADAYQAQQHPERLAVGADGVPASRPGWTEDWYYHLCPVQAPQRERLLAYVDEVVTRYPLNGIDLDFIRFPWKAQNEDGPEREFCFCPTCVGEFKRATGIDPRQFRDDVEKDAWYRWRGEAITSMVRDVAEIASSKGVTLSTFNAFWGSDGLGRRELRTATRRFGQDHAALAVVSQLSPMLYPWFTDEPTCYTERTVRWVRDIVTHLRDLDANVCAVLQGGPPATPLQLIDQVRAAVDADATALMSYPGLSWSLEDRYWTALGRAYGDVGALDPVV